jgi:ABC-type multidrug transport system permease subunit
MQNRRRFWLVPGIGSLQAKLLGASLGLIGGVLLGGVVIPWKLLAAPLTAIGGGLAAVVMEYRMRQIRATPLLPLWGAMIGAVAGMVSGAVVGLLAALALGVYFGATGQPIPGAFGLPVETAAITGVAGLLTGFSLGFSMARQQE